MRVAFPTGQRGPRARCRRDGDGLSLRRGILSRCLLRPVATGGQREDDEACGGGHELDDRRPRDQLKGEKSRGEASKETIQPKPAHGRHGSTRRSDCGSDPEVLVHSRP
jgi:hypothetical protein